VEVGMSEFDPMSVITQDQGILGIQVKDPDGVLGVLISYSNKGYSPTDKIVVLYPDRTSSRIKVWEWKFVTVLNQAYYYMSQNYITQMTQEVKLHGKQSEILMKKYNELEHQYQLLQAALLTAANEKYKN
jgi:hypothetical protein